MAWEFKWTQLVIGKAVLNILLVVLKVVETLLVGIIKIRGGVKSDYKGGRVQ